MTGVVRAAARHPYIEGDRFLLARMVASEHRILLILYSATRVDGATGKGNLMIVLGVIVLIIGWITHISILYTVGSILLVVGLVLLLLGGVGRGIGGRRHYF